MLVGTDLGLGDMVDGDELRKVWYEAQSISKVTHVPARQTFGELYMLIMVPTGSPTEECIDNVWKWVRSCLYGSG